MAFISTPLGLIVGVILALTGSGGGILAIPWLMFGPGLSVAQAGPIGLLAVGIGAVFGAVLGLRAATVRYKAALLMATSPFGLRLASRLDKQISSVLFSVWPLHLETQLCVRWHWLEPCPVIGCRWRLCHGASAAPLYRLDDPIDD